MKEYRVMQLATGGPREGEWLRAWIPLSGRTVHNFKTLEDAQAWIDKRPEWYAEYNEIHHLRMEVPQYRIEAREVTPWEVIA